MRSRKCNEIPQMPKGMASDLRQGHYHDAIYNKHNSVKVMIFDDLGGATSGTAKTIKGLAKNASGKGARDATDYGETHIKCFYQHHSTAISLACVQGSAMSLVTGLENLERSTTYDRNKRANTSVSRDFQRLWRCRGLSNELLRLHLTPPVGIVPPHYAQHTLSVLERRRVPPNIFFPTPGIYP